MIMMMVTKIIITIIILQLSCHCSILLHIAAQLLPLLNTAAQLPPPNIAAQLPLLNTAAHLPLLNTAAQLPLLNTAAPPHWWW